MIRSICSVHSRSMASDGVAVGARSSPTVELISIDGDGAATRDGRAADTDDLQMLSCFGVRFVEACLLSFENVSVFHSVV